MRVRIKDNLGTVDAARLGVDASKCTRGAIENFDEETAEALVKFGIAEPFKGPADVKKQYKPSPPEPKAEEPAEESKTTGHHAHKR